MLCCPWVIVGGGGGGGAFNWLPKPLFCMT